MPQYVIGPTVVSGAQVAELPSVMVPALASGRRADGARLPARLNNLTALMESGALYAG